MMYDKNLNLEGLKTIKDTYGDRIYSNDLIENMQNRNFKYLYNVDMKLRNDPYFMNQLLYAVKKSKGTYVVYQFYGDGLQESERTLLTEIAIKEPEVIEGTYIANNPIVMLELAKVNPEVIKHMSNDLKENSEFIEKVYKECNVSETIQNNPELARNLEAIKADVNVLKHLDDSLKNNYEFIKEASKENKEVINYVAEHTNEFGKEALGAAKEVLVENTTCRAIEEMKTELEKVQEEKLKMESQEGFDKDSEEYKAIKIRARQLSNNIKFIDKIRNGEVEQEKTIRRLNGFCKNMSNDYRAEFLKYIKMDDAVIAKEKEEKDKVTTQEKQRSGYIIGQDAVERVTEESTPSKMNKQSGTMREILNAEKTKESMEVTNNDKWSNGERQ